MHVLPAWKEMLRRSGSDIDLHFCDCHYTELSGDTSIIALDNLSKNGGYRHAINKTRGLNASHVRLALAELAKYHACGYAFVKSAGAESIMNTHPVRMITPQKCAN